MKTPIEACAGLSDRIRSMGPFLRRGLLATAILPATAATMLLAGCTTPKPAKPEQPPPEQCTGAQTYFPAGTFPADYPGSDRLRRQWYSTVLARLNEPSLSCATGNFASYRLIWLNSLAGPVVIRITRQDRNVTLEAFQLSGLGAGDPGSLLYHVHKRLSVVDWGLLQGALARSDFHDLPTSGNMYGLHGEQWIVEGRDAAGYHIVDRWSPPAGSYRDLGVFFFDLAGWQRPYSSKY